MAEPETLVAGLDGCRAGWVMATVPLRGTAGRCGSNSSTDLRDVVGRIEAGTLAAVAIDIPIGLAPDGPRPVDLEARRRLGARRSSVFPAPARAVLAATTYEEACARLAGGVRRGVSRQLFNILPKIRDVDELQSPALQDRLFEMHPEVSFTELAGTPMHSAKRTPEGRARAPRCAGARLRGLGQRRRRSSARHRSPTTCWTR